MIDAKSGVEIPDDTSVGQVLAWMDSHGAESAARNFRLTDLQVRRLLEVYGPLELPDPDEDDDGDARR